MKIAVITDDGKAISQHFGRAQYYLVATVENGQITNREMRPKMGHNHFSNEPHEEEKHGQPHGTDAASHNKHLQMSEVITDCEALLCRGMGRGAYESMKYAISVRWSLILPILTKPSWLTNGQIIDHIEKLH